MEQLFYQPVTLEALAAVVALDQKCLGGLWSVEGYRRELESPNSILRMLRRQPTQSGEIVGIGCFWAILDEAHITLLGIAPEYQRRGLGRWLLWRLLQEAHQQQLHHGTLEVRASNTAAQKLYGSFGFQALGRRRRYYSDGEDALILWRSGLHTADFAVVMDVWGTAIQQKLRDEGWQIADANHLVNRT